MGFFKRVHEIVKLIPEGCVMSYGDIAQVMGEPKKARFVGFAMKFCPGSYPWQRVVRQDGKVVTGNLQVMVLQREGVIFTEPGYVNMERCRIMPAEMQLIIDGASVENS